MHMQIIHRVIASFPLIISGIHVPSALYFSAGDRIAERFSISAKMVMSSSRT